MQPGIEDKSYMVLSALIREDGFIKNELLCSAVSA